MTGRYELKNKGIRLEKVNDNNFVDLMELEVAESQKDYVASNTVSMAQAYAVNASGRFVQWRHSGRICHDRTPFRGI